MKIYRINFVIALDRIVGVVRIGRFNSILSILLTIGIVVYMKFMCHGNPLYPPCWPVA